MKLSERHRRFLLIEQGVVPAVFNFALNAGIAWALFRSVATIPLWGESSVGGDLLVTAFLLPFLTSVIVSALVAREVRSGKVPALSPDQVSQSRWSRRSASLRGLFLGSLSVLFGAIPLVWALSLGQAQPFPTSEFVLFKGVWTAMLALLVTPIVAWWALSHASHARAA